MSACSVLTSTSAIFHCSSPHLMCWNAFHKMWNCSWSHSSVRAYVYVCVNVTSLNYWNPLKIQLIHQDKFYTDRECIYNISESTMSNAVRDLEFNYSTCSPIWNFMCIFIGISPFSAKPLFSQSKCSWVQSIFALSFSRPLSFPQSIRIN